MHNDFCVFIISHNRAGNVPTADALDRYNYTGDWYIVIDDKNDIDAYTDEYGEESVVYLDKIRARRGILMLTLTPQLSF